MNGQFCKYNCPCPRRDMKKNKVIREILSYRWPGVGFRSLESLVISGRCVSSTCIISSNNIPCWLSSWASSCDGKSCPWNWRYSFNLFLLPHLLQQWFSFPLPNFYWGRLAWTLIVASQFHQITCKFQPDIYSNEPRTLVAAILSLTCPNWWPILWLAHSFVLQYRMS